MRFLEPFFRLKFLTCLLFGVLCFITQVNAQTSTDRRNTQPTNNPFLNFELSRSTGAVYYVDQLGLNLTFLDPGAIEFIDMDTYELGPGDLITVSLSGGVNAVFRTLKVNPNGEVFIPNLGGIKIHGLLLHEAENTVRRKVNTAFQNAEVSLSLDRPRNISVHITGDVILPGAHHLPAQSRLDIALISALYPKTNSPTEERLTNIPRSELVSGNLSLRSIRIQRNGEIITGDLAAYQLGGKLEANPILRHGDIINVNKRQQYDPQISISGSVRSPLQLEYHSQDTIQKLIDMAGGFTFDADTTKIFVHRITHQGLAQIPVQDTRHFQLLPNDRVVVGFDEEKRFNYSAQISGEVLMPGTYPIQDGITTVQELMQMSGGFTEKAMIHAARLERAKPWTDITMLTRSYDQYLEGFEYLNLEQASNLNRVFINLKDEELTSKITLFNGDKLIIPENRNSIFVFGQVLNPGYFTFQNTASAFDYIAQAGGYALAANPDRVFVIKGDSNAWLKPSDTTLQQGDIIFVDRQSFDTFAASRDIEFRKRELRNRNLQLVFGSIATIASVITAYVAITNR